jgi:hypothetical protein
MVGEKRADGDVVEFLPVVSLKSMYWTTKLCRHIGIKCEESSGNVGFPTKRKSPHKVRVVIKNNKVI